MPAPTAATDSGAPDALPPDLGKACDALMQDCPDPLLRCTIVVDAGNYLTACELPAGSGTVAEGMTCTRVSPGHDDCAPGLDCLPDEAANFVCRKICGADSQCGSGAKCGSVTNKPPYLGVCWKACAPFGTGCPTGSCAYPHSDNDQATFFESCRGVGTGVIGTPCTSAFDCAAALNCQGKSGFTCKAQCDDDHPCGDGGTCSVSPGLPSDGGVCL